MSNILLQYMVERFNQPASNEDVKIESLPFVTISREYGCPAKEVAGHLEKKLNSGIELKGHQRKWKVISKEIMEQAAHELNVDPSRIEKLFHEEKRSTIDEILDAFSEKYYKSDRLIIHTLTTVIQDFAKKGHIIIIGRNGAGITHNFENALHVRLVAPIEWRIKRLIEKGYFKTIEEARAHADEIDFKRSIFRKTKTVEEPDFDIYYNTKKFSPEQIADSIAYTLYLKSGK